MSTPPPNCLPQHGGNPSQPARWLQQREVSHVPANPMSNLPAVHFAHNSTTDGAITMPRDVSSRFGRRLRELRSERNLTQSDMARKFGIDRSFISDVERGRKSISLVMLDVLALGLGVSISELLSDI